MSRRLKLKSFKYGCFTILPEARDRPARLERHIIHLGQLTITHQLTDVHFLIGPAGKDEVQSLPNIRQIRFETGVKPMRNTALIFMFLSLLITAPKALEQPTIQLDRSRILTEGESGAFGYADFGPVSVGRNMILPGKSFYIQLNRGQTVEDIRFEVLRSVTIGHLPEADLAEDIPTRSEESPRTSVEVNDLISRAEPIQITGQIKVGEQTFAELLLLPLTVSQNGELLFNESVSIQIGQNNLTADQLLSSLPKDPGRSDNQVFPSLSAGIGLVTYLIITSEQFSAPLERLAWYKNSLGILTEVRYIGDILAGQTGRDDAERLRNYLRQFHGAGGRYVLLAGDHTVLPIRYAYHRAADEIPDLSQQQVCDLYFADLTGEWDLDNDNIWGERTHDQADLIPELMVGRLPFNRPEQFEAYVDKLIAYETNPGDGDLSYLGRAFFFSSDQMRDYSGGGQHGRISLAYPDNIEIDTVAGVEADRGDDPNPHNKSPRELEAVLSEGYGIVNILAHGNGSLFEVRTSGYNSSPKERFITVTSSGENGSIAGLEPNRKLSFYYSLACDNGAFDYDYNGYPPNLAVTVLALPKAGAVGFVANSRWGWVGSSHLLQRVFFDSLFSHPGRPAVAAMYESKLRYSYVRDVVYGQNFFGDPTLVVYDKIPGLLNVEVIPGGDQFEVTVSSNGQPVENCLVTLSDSTGPIASLSTSLDGRAIFMVSYSPLNRYTIAAVKTGYTVAREFLVPSIVADTEEERIDDNLPDNFSLSQNYPNPFNPITTIRFELPYRSDISLDIYNILGQQVTSLSSGEHAYGTYEVTWDGRDENGRPVASGIYFYRLITDAFTSTKKMILIR